MNSVWKRNYNEEETAKYIMNTLIYIFFGQIFLASVQGIKINGTNNKMTVLPGDNIKVFMRKDPRDDRLSDCVWSVSPYQDVNGLLLPIELGSEEWHDSDQIDPFRPAGTWRYRWHGEDPVTDCGIEINSASEADHNKWQCLFKGAMSSIDITVAYPPSSTHILNGQNGELTFNTEEDTENFNITCESKQARPPPFAIWSIGKAIVTNSQFTFESSEEDGNHLTFYNTTFKFMYTPKAEHDGLKLGCSFRHFAINLNDAWSFNNTFSRFVTLRIKAPPQSSKFRIEHSEFEVGETAYIKAFFHSNPPPKPNGVYWNLHDLDGPLYSNPTNFKFSKNYDRYVSTTEYLENNEYLATLTINKLLEADEDKRITFACENILGTGEKEFMIPNSTNTLGLEEIVGIIIGVIGIVVLIGIFIFIAHMKYKSGSAEAER